MNIVERRATDLKRGLRHRYAGMVISLIVALAFLVWSTDEALCAAITIAGNGPELRMVERLTRMRLCKDCLDKIKNPQLMAATKAILADEMRV